MTSWRRTRALLRVAAALLAEPDARHYGYPLSKASGVRSGTLYPMLDRLLREGWITDGWSPQATRGGDRRFYRLTDAGRAALTEIVEGGSPWAG